MSLEIPESRSEEDALEQHEGQQRRHEETIEDHERHPEDGRDYHHMKEAKEPGEVREGFRERAERHHDNQEDHELVVEANTELRNE